MVTEEQVDEALKLLLEYKKQTNQFPNAECGHRGAWITIKGHYYCPDCDFAFSTIKCKVCDGKGGFNVGIDKLNKK